MEFEIYSGKTFSDLCKDIIGNSVNKKTQIEFLINELKPLIKSVADAVQLVPVIKEYLDVSVKNDEQLVKLAGVIQRLISSETQSDSNTGLLSDEEKNRLIEEANKELEKINNEVIIPLKQMEK